MSSSWPRVHWPVRRWGPAATVLAPGPEEERVTEMNQWAAPLRARSESARRTAWEPPRVREKPGTLPVEVGGAERSTQSSSP